MYQKEESTSIIKRDNLIIDPKCRLVMVDNKEIILYSKEFDVLYLLAEHPGQVFSKKQIYENLYEGELPINIENTIYCLIHGLRNKLEKDPRHPRYIITVRSVGYKFIKYV